MLPWPLIGVPTPTESGLTLVITTRHEIRLEQGGGGYDKLLSSWRQSSKKLIFFAPAAGQKWTYLYMKITVFALVMPCKAHFFSPQARKNHNLKWCISLRELTDSHVVWFILEPAANEQGGVMKLALIVCCVIGQLLSRTVQPPTPTNRWVRGNQPAGASRHGRRHEH